MGKWLIGALLAATAWTPMAQAQDGGGWRGRHGGGGQQQQQGGWQGRGGWGGNRGQQAQPQAQVGVQAQAEGQRRSWGGGGQADARAQASGGWQGRRDWQRQQPQANADAQAYRQQRFDGRDRTGDGRPDGYRDRNGDGRPNYADRDRNGDGRPDAFRDRNGDGRYDGWNRGGRGQDSGRQTFRYDGRGYGNDGRWNNGWRRDDRYDWNRYRSYNRNVFRLPRYYAPYGWSNGYRRFSIGVVLSSALWGQNYWIDDPYEYRLPEAYGPYRWVRYYNDALLIDLRSGVVVDTVYDIFWY